MLLLPAQHPTQSLPMTPVATSSSATSRHGRSPSASQLPRTDSERWSALTTRNPIYANAFIYAVITTRIYCRPNCPSRLARRANIEFFTAASEAVAAGYRPCKRCKPEQGDEVEDDGVEKVRKAVGVIKEKAKRGEKVTLSELSREVGLSKWHLQRAFKRRVGVSPKEMGERIERDQQEQDVEKKVADVGGDAGTTEGVSNMTVEGEMMFTSMSTPGSIEEGLTDSKSWSPAEVSSLPTPVPLDSMMEMEGTGWLTGWKTDDADVLVPPFGQHLDFADMSGFDPEVEFIIRDLFPEIYTAEI